MARKRDSASKRLARAIERRKNPDLLTRLFLSTSKASKLDWTNKRTRELAANSALTLTERPGDTSLRKAFDEFGLNPQNPFDWVRLLRGLAEVHFDRPIRRPRGAPPKWDERRRMLFQTHVAMARRNTRKIAQKYGDPPPTNDDIADYVCWKWPEYYRNIEVASIRRYIASGPPGATQPHKRR
jgi:hypothetical protein